MISIRADGLSVRYAEGRRRVVALRDLSFAIGAGELVGVVGPNGAGKTSLLRLLAGEVSPVAGAIVIGGRRASSRAARARVGFAPDPPRLPPELTGVEWLTYLASHRVHHPAERLDRVRWAVELAQLEPFAARRISGLSRGMAQRLALAGAALCGTGVLLLDETLSGVDPLVQRDLRDGLARLAREGRVVIVASHDLGTLERLATRVLVLSHGRLMADVRTAQLLSGRVLELALDGSGLAFAAALCARFPGAVRTGEGIAVPLQDGLTAEQVLAACRGQRVVVAATRVRYRALEDVLAASVQEAACAS